MMHHTVDESFCHVFYHFICTVTSHMSSPKLPLSLLNQLRFFARAVMIGMLSQRLVNMWGCGGWHADRPGVNRSVSATALIQIFSVNWCVWTFGWLESKMTGISIWGGFFSHFFNVTSISCWKGVSRLQMAFQLRSAAAVNSHENTPVSETASNLLDFSPHRH